MIYYILFSLFLGIICGGVLLPTSWTSALSYCSDPILALLMFSVGVSIGVNKSVFSKLRQYHIKLFLLPLGIIIGSFLSSYICAAFTGDTIKTALSITSGMGWYSLSSVMVTGLIHSEAGAVAFLSNMMRELLSFVLMPVFIRFGGPNAAIAAAGATSEDTALPFIIRYAGEDSAVIAVINGMICSAAVPVLIHLACKYF